MAGRIGAGRARPDADQPADQASGHQLRVNPIACVAHGLCAELLPELVGLDEWGYPVIDGVPVPVALVAPARRAVAACPTLALRLDGRRGRHG